MVEFNCLFSGLAGASGHSVTVGLHPASGGFSKIDLNGLNSSFLFPTVNSFLYFLESTLFHSLNLPFQAFHNAL